MKQHGKKGKKLFRTNALAAFVAVAMFVGTGFPGGADCVAAGVPKFSLKVAGGEEAPKKRIPPERERIDDFSREFPPFTRTGSLGRPGTGGLGSAVMLPFFPARTEPCSRFLSEHSAHCFRLRDFRPGPRSPPRS